MTTKTDTAAPTSTPYIAVAAHYYGTGKSSQEARKSLVKAGGSPQEDQTVFKLPDGALDAFVSDAGIVHWEGVEGEMRPVFRYKGGKAIAWGQGEDKPIPFHAKNAKTKPRHNPDAQIKGEIHPEPQLEVVAEPAVDAGMAQMDEVLSQPKPAKVAKPKKSKPEPAPMPEPEVVAESAQEPTPEPETQPEIEPAPVAAKPAKKAPAAKPVAAPQQAVDGPADFLLFIGGNFYNKETFTTEAATLGISRRMPSHRLPKGLVSGKSKVYVAAEGVRKTDGTPSSEVFGYFIPSAVEFIVNGKNKEFADVIAALIVREDVKLVGSTKSEPARHCGTRVDGGTYIVVDKAETPLHTLVKPAHYEGNHFRGLMKLSADMVKKFNTGGIVATLVDESCMKCGDAMKCAPDGHARAVRERKRMEKGQPAKWLLLDSKCQKELRAARAADDGVQAVDESGDGSVDEGSTDGAGDAVQQD